MNSPTAVLAVLAALVFVGLALEELFRRTGIPDVLILLALGIVASVTGVLDVEAFRGADRIFTTCALVLILFEGAVRMRLDELKSALGSSLTITAVNFVLTTAVIGVLATVLFQMRPLASVLLGAILGGTSSAVVIPMVQTLKIAQHTRTTLALESALSDVLCIVATLALVGALSAGNVAWGEVGLDLVKGFLGALAIGAVLGVGWAVGLRTLRQKRASLLVVGAAVFIVYAIAEALGTFGAIAVLSFGVVVGNAPKIAKGFDKAHELGLYEGEKVFLGETAFLLKILFFVYLGASLRLSGFEPIVFGGLATIAFFAIRPLVVRVSFRARTTTKRDALVAAALVPKGLAAAVLAAVPSQAGIAEGRTIEAVVFGCILFSITLASALVIFADKPFVAAAYQRIFGAYQADAAEAPVPTPSAPLVGAEIELDRQRD
ncbi:MAG: cation:proton antiporter [Myxococcota bacterium]